MHIAFCTLATHCKQQNKITAHKQKQKNESFGAYLLIIPD
jgi:hypothetical protein